MTPSENAPVSKSPAACCDSATQESCCPPEAKSTCCGPSAPVGSCGCQPVTPKR